MSNSTKQAETAETAAAVAAVETPAAPAATKYPASRLRKDCFALYGVSTSTFDGANVGVAGDAEFTVEEMRERIKKWQASPVKTTKKEDK